MSRFEKFLDSREAVLLDGAMGTMMFGLGMPAGHPPEEWNVSNPAALRQIHKAYVEAGSDIILTNSFGGTCYRLKLHDLQDRVYELNHAAATIAREVADAADREVMVAGSIGPSGELLEPMGSMSYSDCAAAFADQARGLAEGGVDVLWIETMSDLNEVRAAFEGARRVTDLPICATLSFDTAGRSMMGVTGEMMVQELADMGFAALGANCGNNLPEIEAAIYQMRAANPTIPLIAKANAGIPQWVGEELVYNGTPDVMAGYAHRVNTYGAKLIGGCCGTGPEHIRRMRAVLDGDVPVPDVAPPPPIPGAERGVPAQRQRKRRRRKGK